MMEQNISQHPPSLLPHVFDVHGWNELELHKLRDGPEQDS